MSEDFETCSCELCVATRRALDRHGITDPKERELLREYIDATAEVCNVLVDAEDAGFDFQRKEVIAVMDEVFDEDEKPTHCH